MFLLYVCANYIPSFGRWVGSVHSFHSRYLNVLIKTLQLHAKVENLKIRRLIRKLAAFQWAEQFPLHACNSNWGPQSHTSHVTHLQQQQQQQRQRQLERAVLPSFYRMHLSRSHSENKPVSTASARRRQSACAECTTPRPDSERPPASSITWNATSMRSNTALRTSWARVGARKSMQIVCDVRSTKKTWHDVRSRHLHTQLGAKEWAVRLSGAADSGWALLSDAGSTSTTAA